MTAHPPITFVLPYYNEKGFVGRTIASLANQSDKRFRLVLVDNGSTDCSEEEARQACRALEDIDVIHLREDTPGKLHAMARGLGQADTIFVGTLDADTIYPPDYVKLVLAEFAADDSTVAVLAFVLMSPISGKKAIGPAKSRFFATWLPHKCHSGGCGQSFRREALERIGGFDPERWPWVLEDHEIMHRLAGIGRLAYRSDHVCYPSDRRSDRTNVGWGAIDRMLYKLLPNALMDWFFYSYLATKFARQKKANAQLRSRTWKAPDPLG